MKRVFFVPIILISLYFTSCNESNNPVSDKKIEYPVEYCTTDGLEIDFEDTCSYNFVIPFISSFDSVVIGTTHLGAIFYIYANSGDYNYWADYFRDDSTIQYIFNLNSSSDTLILKIVTSGEKSIEEEKQRLLHINNLQIINIEEQLKYVIVKVPKDTEFKWEAIFSQYIFISRVFVIGVCTDASF